MCVYTHEYIVVYNVLRACVYFALIKKKITRDCVREPMLCVDDLVDNRVVVINVLELQPIRVEVTLCVYVCVGVWVFVHVRTRSWFARTHTV